MQAIRISHEIFILDQMVKGDNLALRLSKFNADIDNHGEHEQKELMLDTLCAYAMSREQKSSYEYAFNHWQTLMQSHSETLSFNIKSTTKCLLGMGNASVHEFGVSLNHPFGVPYISGTVIKGLLSAYLAKHGGDAWYKSPKDSKKSDLQVELFGGDLEQNNETKSYIGSVVFNDAWLIPTNNKWFVPDIINVHHQSYYSQKRLPDGIENPIPVKLAAMSPDLEFFVSLQGDDEAINFLLPVLEKALIEEGLGSKTATGYGRFELTQSRDDILKYRENIKKELALVKIAQEKEKETARQRASMTEYAQIVFDLENKLSETLTDNIKTEVNKSIKEAEANIEQWSTDEREQLADFMKEWFDQTGWFETGKNKKQKDKQTAKKELRITKIRG